MLFRDGVLLAAGVGATLLGGPVVVIAAGVLRAVQIYGAVHAGTKLTLDLIVPEQDLEKIDLTFGGIGLFGRWKAVDSLLRGKGSEEMLRDAYRFQSFMDIGLGIRGGTLFDATQAAFAGANWYEQELKWRGQSQPEFRNTWGLDLGPIELDPYFDFPDNFPDNFPDDSE